jgi:hypothetical protein
MDDQQRWGQNKKLFIILIVYFAINISIKWLDSDTYARVNAFTKITQQNPLAIDDLLQLIDFEETYEGTWTTP